MSSKNNLINLYLCELICYNQISIYTRLLLTWSVMKVFFPERETICTIFFDLQTLPEVGLSSLGFKSKWFFFFRRIIEFHTFLRLILTPRWQSRDRDDSRAPNVERLRLVYNRTLLLYTTVIVQQVGHPTFFPSIKHVSYQRVIVKQQTTWPLPRNISNHPSIPINLRWYFHAFHSRGRVLKIYGQHL